MKKDPSTPCWPFKQHQRTPIVVVQKPSKSRSPSFSTMKNIVQQLFALKTLTFPPLHPVLPPKTVETAAPLEPGSVSLGHRQMPWLPCCSSSRNTGERCGSLEGVEWGTFNPQFFFAWVLASLTGLFGILGFCFQKNVWPICKSLFFLIYFPGFWKENPSNGQWPVERKNEGFYLRRPA